MERFGFILTHLFLKWNSYSGSEPALSTMQTKNDGILRASSMGGHSRLHPAQKQNKANAREENNQCPGAQERG